MRKFRTSLVVIVIAGALVLSAGLLMNRPTQQIMSKAWSGLSDSSGYTLGGDAEIPILAQATATTVMGEATHSLKLSRDVPGPAGASGDSIGTSRDSTSSKETNPAVDRVAGAGSGGTTDYTDRRDAPIRTAPEAPYQPAVDQDPLKASEVDDNADYASFVKYMKDYTGSMVASPDLSERYIVQVLNGQQLAVADAEVTISANGQILYNGRSTSDGRVVFFPRAAAGSENATSFDVTVRRDGQSAKATLARGSTANGPLALTLNVAAPTSVNLDVVFLIDSTGSMGDEIAKVKATIHNIAGQIGQLPGQPNLRLGLVTYRDRGDDNQFVTRKWDFTSDVNTFATELDTLEAYNGGDYPEDVDAGLEDALNLPGWSQTNSHSLRLVFLVGDAPPHMDYSDEPSYATLSGMAAAKGIKVFPIAASGLSAEGELIFRQMAAMTLGKFVFLTYAATSSGGAGNGGPSGDTTQMHVDNYQTNNLDDVVVRLVSEEVANQSKQASVQQVRVGQMMLNEQGIPPLGSTQVGMGGGALGWLLALGWLPLLVGGLIVAYRRQSERARVSKQATVRVATEDEAKLESQKGLPVPTSIYIQPATHWARALSEQPTTRI